MTNCDIEKCKKCAMYKDGECSQPQNIVDLFQRMLGAIKDQEDPAKNVLMVTFYIFYQTLSQLDHESCIDLVKLMKEKIDNYLLLSEIEGTLQ